MCAADEPAFGSRDDKLAGCKLQRRAWDVNTKLLAPVFTAIREPLSRERRSRGEHGVTYERQAAVTIRKRDQLHEISEEMDAKRALEEAAGSAIGHASRSVLL